MDWIIEQAVSHFGYTKRQLKSSKRTRQLVDVRFMICALARFEDIAYTAIAKALNRNYSTIMHAVQMHIDLVKTNEEYRAKFKEFEKIVNNFKHKNQ